MENALIAAGAIQRHAAESFTPIRKPCITLEFNWARTQNKNDKPLDFKVLDYLNEAFKKGSKNKSFKISPEKAHQQIMETIIQDDWRERLNCTIFKIRSFFGATASKQQRLIKSALTDLQKADTDSQVEKQIIREELMNAATGNSDVEESEDESGTEYNRQRILGDNNAAPKKRIIIKFVHPLE